MRNIKESYREEILSPARQKLLKLRLYIVAFPRNSSTGIELILRKKTDAWPPAGIAEDICMLR